jgi:5-methyltetrahydropteroyltriglutamate--homocysteine methyltransferase
VDELPLTPWGYPGILHQITRCHTKQRKARPTPGFLRLHNHGAHVKTPLTAALPLFYTHPIGSLPRPQVVRALLARRHELPTEEYRRTLDDLVLFAIRLQEQAGLDVISDGEWRRTQYIREFLLRVGGFEKVRRYSHQGETKLTEVVVRRMEPQAPVFAEDARFLTEHTDRVTKFALPSPFLIAVRYWHEDHSRTAYPTCEHFLEHLAEILAREARALVEAGIDIVQLDDPALTYFCDERLLAGQTHDDRLRRAWDIEREFPRAVAAINRVAEGLRAEVHLHCCHSVYKRCSDVTGDYKPILPRLAEARVDRINLEFAYPGTGDVGDLKSLPEHLNVGLGVIDVRSEQLQSVAEIESIATAAANLLSPQRIALNPDCGFAPDAGEPPTIDEAYEKLRRLVAAAQQLRARFPRPEGGGIAAPSRGE